MVTKKTFDVDGCQVVVDAYSDDSKMLRVTEFSGKTVSVPLDGQDAAEIGIALRSASNTAEDYEYAVQVLFERIASAAEKAQNPALKDVLLALGLGFAIDMTPDTQEVVKALVGR